MIDPAAIRVSRLDSGLTLITERIPTVRSASIGFWVQRGSRDEPEDRNGIAHFVEHMLFKGTSTRSNRDIAFAIDAMGGQLDAFTSKELTSYWAQVLDEQLPAAFELLADLVQRPRFDPDEMERERRVILEEIAAAEDDPEDVLFERFQARLWGDNPMGRPILGTVETVSEMSTDMLHEYLRGLRAGDLLVAAAGNLEHEVVEQLAAEWITDIAPGPAQRLRVAPSPHPHVEVIDREGLEQTHLYLACEAPSGASPDRYTVHLLNTILGGSVSSRLFQSIRERHGLAYSVYSVSSGYSDCGYLSVHASTRPENAERVVELALEDLRLLREELVPDEELRRMKDHLKGGLMLGLENTFGRMANLARQQIGFGRTFGLDEILGGIESVTAVAIRELAARLFAEERLAVGAIARPEAATGLRESWSDGRGVASGGGVGSQAIQ